MTTPLKDVPGAGIFRGNRFSKDDDLVITDLDKNGFTNYRVIRGGDFSTTAVEFLSRFVVVWDGPYKHRLVITGPHETDLTVRAGVLAVDLFPLLKRTHERRFGVSQ